MGLETALRLLGLPKNFTEEELKKSYRKLSKENHPDVHGNSTEENQKLINSAHEVAKKYLKKRGNIQSSSSEKTNDTYAENIFTIENYKKAKLEALNRKVDFINYESQVESSIIRELIFSLTQYKMLFIMEFRNKNTKQEIDITYESTVKNINYEFHKIAQSFCREYDIQEDLINDNLDYFCNIDVFYKQLLLLKDKYSKLEPTKNRLEQEISKYKVKETYLKLKKQIEEYRDETIAKIRNNNYTTLEEEITNLHNKIQLLFQKYEFIEQKIKEIASDITLLNDETLNKIFNNIKKDWEENINIEKSKNNLSNLDDLISKQKEEIRFYKGIQPIYEILLERKTKLLKEKNIIKDYKEIQRINKQFDEVLELLKRGCDERKYPDFFQLFYRIYFTNEEAEQKVLETIKFQTRRVYIKKQEFHQQTIDRRSFFFIEDNYHNYSEVLLYRVDANNIEEITISKEELTKEYIALEEIIIPQNIVGEYQKERNTDQIYLVLAENENITVYKDKEKYFIRINEYIDLVDNYGEEKLDNYELIGMITQYLRERIEETNRKKR